MDVYLSTWSLHRLFFQKLLRVTDMPMLAASLGFDGVELEDIWFPSLRESVVRSLTSASRRSGMPLLIAVSNDFTVASPTALRTQIRHTVRFLRIAAAVGSGTVRVLIGSKNPEKGKIPQVVKAFREILPVATSLNVKLAIENHDPLSRNPDILDSVLKQIDGRGIGVCLDFGNLSSRSRYNALAKLAPKAMLVHAKTCGFKSDGSERWINYARCFRILRNGGFKGPVVAEYDGPGDQLAGSLRTLSLVRRFTA